VPGGVIPFGGAADRRANAGGAAPTMVGGLVTLALLTSLLAGLGIGGRFSATGAATGAAGVLGAAGAAKIAGVAGATERAIAGVPGAADIPPSIDGVAGALFPGCSTRLMARGAVWEAELPRNSIFPFTLLLPLPLSLPLSLPCPFSWPFLPFSSSLPFSPLPSPV